MQAESQAGSVASCKDVEKAKYERIWEVEEYSESSPAYHRFFDDIQNAVKGHESVIEFGCGSGLALAELAKSHVILGVDIADNCLSVDVPFVQACLWEPMNVQAEVGYCVDVMEHIPTDKVEAVFKEIMACVSKCLFIPCLLPDRLGEKHLGEPLHLTVKPAEWWLSTAAKFGKVNHIRTTGRAVFFVVER